MKIPTDFDPEKSSDTNSCSSYNIYGKQNVDNIESDRISYGKSGFSVSSTSTIGKNYYLKREAEICNVRGPIAENSLKGLADYILSGKCKNVIVLTGAGISTSTGIPDFRSPSVGMYATLEKYNFPFPEMLFNINYFRSNPKPLYEVGKSYHELITKAKPTLTHYFIKLLQDYKILLRNYTQNVDGLERKAGIDPNNIIESHGTLATASCIDCKTKVDINEFYKDFTMGVIKYCTLCGSLVKPDIILFGEQLPNIFFEKFEEDSRVCDLLIVMGTSLSVGPINTIPQFIPPNVPRLLINKEIIDIFRHTEEDTVSHCCSEVSSAVDVRRFSETNQHLDDSFEKTYSIDDVTYPGSENMNLTVYHRDIVWLGNCDEGCWELIKHLGWTKMLDAYMSSST